MNAATLGFHSAPALQVVLVLEESPRVGLVAATHDDQLRLAVWLRSHPAWMEAVETLAGRHLDIIAPAPAGTVRGAA